MTLKAWLGQAYQELKAKEFEQPRAEAEMFASELLGFSRAKLVTLEENDLSVEQQKLLNGGLVRRIKGEPLAYIVGFKDFYKSRFHVGAGVLIPRPETELVVELALGLRNRLPAESRIADFGAGTGCIGISTVLEWKEARLIAVENSPEALKYLARNISELGVASSTEIREATVESLSKREFNLIVANPPYIAENDAQIEIQVRTFEPGPALFSDDMGYGAIKRWLKVGAETLHPGGFLIMEVGATQTKELLSYKVESLNLESVNQDLAGHDRVLIWRKS